MKAHFVKKAAPIGSAAGLILAACAVPAWAQTSNLLLNPDFQSPADPGSNNDYECTGWNFILDAERGGFHPGPEGEYWSIWLKTFEGTEISNPTGIAGNTSGGIYQDVTIPTSGDGTNYTLSADFLFEAGYSQSGSQLDYQMAFLNSSGFQVGNSTIGYINPTDPNAQTANTWFPYTITGQAPVGSTQIQVEFDWIGGSTVSGEAQSAFVSEASLLGVGTPPGQFQWIYNGIGDWNNDANWSTGNVPNGAGVEADFFGAITANTTVADDSTTPIVLGILHFNNSNTYSLSGPYTSSLVMQGATGTAALVQVDQGTQEIDIPFTIASNCLFTVSPGATLLIANPMTVDAGDAVTQSGGGTVTYQSLVTLQSGASLSIGNATIGSGLSLASSAKVALTPAASGTAYTVQFNSLSMATGSSMDLASNKFVVNYAGNADPAASIASYIAAGYAGGKWNGAGIFSSTIAASDASQSKLIYALGYADGADGLTSVPSGEILIEPTLAGDAKLQGDVVFGDFQLLAQYFGKAGGWDEGNFTYGPTVDFGDFQELAQDFGQSAAGGLTAGELSSLNSFAAEFGDTLVANPGGGFTVAVVPEPASISLLALGGIALLSRRRRNTQE
ncbi:MAG TPA: PEP-CTERM sorting domain-containing protein [Tepidisphaeraceae bacterium]|nr:PEP-CTERM sorting domain-containing protein [Tepidisphaeraceae bacterium]